MRLAPALVGALSACGGGGSEPVVVPPVNPSPPTAPNPSPRDPGWIGAFSGTLSGSPAQQVFAALGGAGYLLAVVGETNAGEFTPRSLLVSWSSTSGALTHQSSSGVWVSDTLQTGLGIDVTVDPSSSSIDGEVVSAGQSRTITTSALPNYRIDAPAVLGSITGRWELTTSTGRSLSIDIDAQGVIAGTSGDCSLYDSRIAPTSTGVALFAITLRFVAGSLGCTEPHGGSDGVHGFALVHPAADGGLRMVIGAENGWDPVFLAAAGRHTSAP